MNPPAGRIPFPAPPPGERPFASGRAGEAGAWRRLVAAFLACVAWSPAGFASGAGLAVSVSTVSPAKGDPVAVGVSATGQVDHLVLRWKGADWPPRQAGPGRYEGLIGVDLDDPEGPAPLSVEGILDGARFHAEIGLNVSPRAFDVQELALPKEMAVFDNATLLRIEAEAADLARRFSEVTPPRWRMPFQSPVEEYRPANFGSRRVINGEPRMPHAGVDLRLPEGTPVRSIADGRVAFAGDRFFGGKSVVIDHGGGVFSIYHHLSEYVVTEGADVEQGDRIGSVGATGRATGPHLHFGVRVPGGRIDPTRLLALPGG